MRHLKILFFVVIVLVSACTKQEKPVDFVDPFIGTDFHGHTYPGATTPFGAVQLSPDTRINNWDACSGYHYSDSTILGFSHLHLSGTGAADLGDILFHPTTKAVNFESERYIFDPLPFSHDNEIAKPGYYSVEFKEQGIKAELTATPRSGIHRYTFPASETSKIIIDLHHSVADETVHHAEFNVVSETEITGARISSGWTPNQHVYFVARFSKPFGDVKFLTDGKVTENADAASGTNVHAVFGFTTSANEQIEVNVGISVVSIENARLNLDAEAPEFDFDGLKKKAYQLWDNALNVAHVDGATTDQKKTFYTALYHTMVVPNLVSDINGEYRGHDMTIKKMPEGKQMYSTLSIWDTFRTWHPLMTLIDDKLVNNMIHSMLSMYDDTGELPIWPLVSGETGTMIGYHSVSVIADAFRKGITGYDVEHAFEAMKVSSLSHRKGGKYYVENGFIPAEKMKESVSCLLEYAYDDWCIAMMAKELGREEDYETYSKRAYSWINVFDGHTRFFRGKRSDGNWVEPFNPFLVSRDYTEANAWQYRFFVPHDVNGLVQMFGGKEQFLLDFVGLFDESTEVISEIPDVTGLIGQYAHGNEPSHHMAYIYSFLGQPWKTQQFVRRVLDEMYSSQPDGISGNEDCGQMSAWYIMSSMGFYPVAPGSNEYVFTTPLFEKSSLKLHNGKTLKVNANYPTKNIYIKKVSFNGREITANFITHQELMQGGTLSFELTDKPDMERGTKPEHAPYSMTTEKLVSVPFIKQDVNLFEESITVELGTATESAEIYFTLDASEPTKESQLYVEPIELNENKTIKARAFKEGHTPSRLFSVDAVKAVYKNADRKSAGKHGTAYKYYHSKFASVYEMAATPVIAQGVLEEPTIGIATREDDFGFEFSGLLYVEEDGIYDFYTESDDGSMLHIGENVVVSNDGSHGAIRSTGRIALKRGYHTYTLLYFEDYAGQKLDWGWKKSNEADFRNIDKSKLFLK